MRHNRVRDTERKETGACRWTASGEIRQWRRNAECQPTLPALGAAALMILPVTPAAFCCQCDWHLLLHQRCPVSAGYPLKHDLMQLKWACIFALPLRGDSRRLLICSTEHNVLHYSTVPHTAMYGKRLNKYIGCKEGWWSTRAKKLFLFILLLIFLFLHSIIHPSPAILTPPPSLQCLHSAILLQSSHHVSHCGQDRTGGGWDKWLVAASPTQSAAQTPPNSNILRPWGGSPCTLHGDLMLMATLEELL